MATIFRLTRYVDTITDESASAGDVSSTEVTVDSEPTSLRDTLDELKGMAIDNLDVGRDRIIAYPADSYQDTTSGDYERETVVVKGSAHNLARLVRIYRHYRPKTYIS